MKNFALFFALLYSSVAIGKIEIKDTKLYVGTDTASDIYIYMNRSGTSDPYLKWNNTAGKLTFAHDGSTEETLVGKAYVDSQDTGINSTISTNDAAAVHKTGNESVAGTKTFTGKSVASSTTSGFHPCPSMTDAQMTAIATPSDGDCVHNTTLDNWMAYKSSVPGWEELAGGGSGGIDDWITAVSYAVGDVVIESYKIYYCISAHTSGTFATDLAGGKWQIIKGEAASIVNVPSGNLASTTVQGALNELQGDIDTNTTNIATNTSNIATNTSNIATNAANIALKEDLSNKSTSTSLGTSDTLYPSQKAVKTYVDTGLAAKEPTITLLPLSKGGTNKNITAGGGKVIYTDSDSFEQTAAGTSGQILESAGTGTPIWVNKSISGKAGSASSVTVEEVQTENHHLTATGTNKYKIETGNTNILDNWSFDAAVDTTADTTPGFTITATGTATCDISQVTTNLLDGQKNALRLDIDGGASGGTCSIKQNATTTMQRNALVGFSYRLNAVGPGACDLVYGEVRTLINGSSVTSRTVKNCGTTLNWEYFYVNEVTGTTSTGVELVLTAAASNVYFSYIDLAKVNLGDNTAVAAVDTPWESCTTTGTWTSNTTYSCLKRQNGPDMEFQFKATVSGAPTAASLCFNLPTGYTVDESKLQFGNGQVALKGSGIAWDNSAAAGWPLAAEYYSSGPFICAMASSASATYTQRAGVSSTVPYTFANLDTVVLTLSVPVKEVAATTSIFQSECGVACENILIAKVATTGTVSDENVDFINGSCSISSTDMTCTTQGLTAAPTCVAINNTASTGSQVFSVTTTSSQIAIKWAASTVRNAALICGKAASDYQLTRLIAATFKGVPFNSNGGKLGLESCRIPNSGTPTVDTASGLCAGWISSLTDNAVGQTYVNWSSSFWYSAPVCWTEVETTDRSHLALVDTANNRVFVRTRTVGSTPADSDIPFTINCFGFRN